MNSKEKWYSSRGPKQRNSSENSAGKKVYAVRTLFFFLVCVSVFAVYGCAGFPDKKKITAVEPAQDPPFIMGAQQPFSKEKRRAVIDRFQQQAGPTDILSHHIRAMEKISKSPIISGNKVTLLRDGPETLASMKEAIRNAKDHIHLEIFIFRDDKVGRPLADLLIAKQAQGVQVRLIYDGFGSRKTPKQFFEGMQPKKGLMSRSLYPEKVISGYRFMPDRHATADYCSPVFAFTK